MNDYNKFDIYNSSFDEHSTDLYGQRFGARQPPPPQEPSPPVQPAAPDSQHKSPKQQKMAPRIIACVLAASIISGAAGGGTAYWILKENTGNTTTATVQADTGSLQVAQTSTGSSGLQDITQVVQKASPSVVEISTMTTQQNFFYGSYESQSAGSGVIVTEDGYIVTNYHVIEDVAEITVRTQDGTEYTATLVGTDDQTDLAVLKIDAGGLTPVTFANSDTAQVGELAVAIGNPLGTLGGTVTNGIISATNREITLGNETMNLLQTSAAVNPGNSGGGLFNSEGNLVGIINAKSTGVDIEGLGFAIPSNTVREVVNEIIENGYVTGRPQLGISIVEVTDAATARMYRLSEPGVYVVTAGADSPLESGDRFVRIDGDEVASSSDIRRILDRHSVGDEIGVEVIRGGQTIEVTVTLNEKMPESIQQQLANSAKA